MNLREKRELTDLESAKHFLSTGKQGQGLGDRKFGIIDRPLVSYIKLALSVVLPDYLFSREFSLNSPDYCT